MTPIRSQIEALWWSKFSAADVAFAINAKASRIRHVSPAAVRRVWRDARRDGRLPPFERPADGWSDRQLAVLSAVREFIARAA